MRKLVIDRFESEYAICELDDRTFISIPIKILPPSCKEGDCLIQEADGSYRIDSITRKVREAKIRDKMRRLFE